MSQHLIHWRPDSKSKNRRSRYLRFERFAQTTAEAGYVESLGHLFQTMAEALRRRWPVQTHQLPFYSAFTEEA